MADMQYVNSSNVEQVGYDSETMELTIAFKNGSTYSYSGVPDFVFDQLLSASSVGSYFNREIKDVYPYTRT